MPRFVGYPTELKRTTAAAKRQAVSDARTLLKAGQEYREQKRHATWRRSERQYEGKHWNDGAAPRDPLADLVTVNMSFSTVNTIAPYITGNEPAFNVMPASGDATLSAAKAQEAMVTRWWASQDTGAQPTIEDSAVDALIYGDGFTKVGYTIETRRVSDEEESDVATIWLQRISVWDLWIDPEADGIHNARWVCQRIRLPYGDLKADGRYKNTGWGNVGGRALRSDDSDRPDIVSPIHDGEDDNHTIVEIFEFYDLVSRRLITFADGELPLQWVEDIGGVPIVPMPNYRLPGSPYHIGELEQLWDLQMELNKTRSQMATHRRRNIPKYLARRGILDSDAQDALQSEIVNDVAEISTSEPIDEIVKAIGLQPLSGDVYNMSQIISGDIYEISGVNEYLRGAAPNIRRTATEATIIEGASNVKTAAKLRMVERAVQKIAKLYLDIAADVYPETDFDEVSFFLTGREAEAVSRADYGTQVSQLRAAGAGAAADQVAMAARNQPADDITVTPSAVMFEGRYEVTVGSASTELRNPIMREQKYKDMVLTMAELMPTLQAQGVTVNMAKLLRQWLESSGISEVDSIISEQPSGPPMSGMGGGMAAPQIPGMPNSGTAHAPTDLISALNSGTLPPAG